VTEAVDLVERRLVAEEERERVVGMVARGGVGGRRNRQSFPWC
jgi:hypothetical protein